MIRAAYRTDRGSKRTHNEDALFCMESDHFYMVADGVGGHNAGELASSVAAEIVGAYVRHKPLKRIRNEELLKKYFLICLQEANEAVCRVASQRETRKGMATTALITCVRGGKAYVVNIGDSRAYLIRDGKMMRITEDHTYVNQLVKEGQITREEAESHPDRNMITRALGAGEQVEPDFFQFEVFQGDKLLMCTDGLYNEVPEEEICRLISGFQDLELLTDELVDRARDYGGNDNITVICIAI